MSYNKTQLHPDIEFERHIFHRDQFAHYLRFTHVIRIADIGMKILDWGCANGQMLEVFYRNKFRPTKYLGLDIRKKTILDTSEKFRNLSFAEFQIVDLCGELNYGNDWDVITSFEVIEHIGKKNGDKFLQNINKHINERTILLLSTPCYDEKTVAANNHIIDGEIGEFTYQELKSLLEKYFIIENVFGTFASQKDYKPFMNEWQKNMYEGLKKYYDSNLVSNFMAPFFPEYSRNCLWKCRKK